MIALKWRFLATFHFAAYINLEIIFIYFLVEDHLPFSFSPYHPCWTTGIWKTLLMPSFCMHFFAVVNLTLIDLPGLTKVAVGKPQYISQYVYTILVVFWEESLEPQTYNHFFPSFLKRDSRRVLFKILKTWSALMLKR